MTRVGSWRLAAGLLAAFLLPAALSGEEAGTTEQVAPGVTHRWLRYSRGGSPFSVHVLEVDPGHYAVNLLPVRALDRASGKETVSSMAKRYGAAAAVNGGYFEVSGVYAGTSHGPYLLNGQVLTSGARRSALLLCQEVNFREHAEIDVVNFQGTVTAQDGSTFNIAGMNRPRGSGEMVIYTPMLGPATKTSAPGVEVIVGENGRIREVNKGLGDSSIPGKGYVLSASGEAALWLERHAKTGARMRVEARLNPVTPGKNGCRPEDIIGGGPRLVERGEIHVTDERLGHAAARHPRTAFAVTRKGTFLFYTVDGRQPSSAGMTTKELAAELVALGAVEAVNLDGGGSTTIAVNGSVRNSPSDGHERPVSDAILVFSIPDLPALEAAVERLAPDQIRPELLEKLRGTFRAAVPDRQKLQAVAKMVRAADGQLITPGAARLLTEATGSLLAR